IDPEIRTAYAHFWSAAAERGFGQHIRYALEYSGSKGVDLYSISYPNQAGLGNVYAGFACTVGCRTPLTYFYNEDVGYRGNQGFSKYSGVNNRLTVTNLLHSRLTLTAVYTWSHAVDNISSTFFE